ncbi:MAG: exonuclease domain-containing protein [Anaerolineae bacterium]
MYKKQFPTMHEEHDYQITDDAYYTCTRCGHKIKSLTKNGVCLGVPIIHNWNDVPDHVATKTALERDHGKKLADGQQPVMAKAVYDRKGKFQDSYYPLYLIADAEDKAPPTEAQLEALEKARYMAGRVYIKCVRCRVTKTNQYDDPVTITRKQSLSADPWTCHICRGRDESIEWSQKILQRDDVVILDTETSGLHGEIIEIAIIDNRGNTILDQRIKPVGEIKAGAQRVHGITLDDLTDEPTFDMVYPQIVDALKDKMVVIYNRNFDLPRFVNDCERHGLPYVQIESFCAMENYSRFIGEWNDYYKNYRWQKLPSGDHSALGDARATLRVIRAMAGADEAITDRHDAIDHIYTYGDES